MANYKKEKIPSQNGRFSNFRKRNSKKEIIGHNLGGYHDSMPCYFLNSLYPYAEEVLTNYSHG
jgi:hypothetical protein